MSDAPGGGGSDLMSLLLASQSRQPDYGAFPFQLGTPRAPAPAARDPSQIWSPGNAVGTETLRPPPQLTMQRGAFDPMLNASYPQPGARPLTQGEYDAWRQGSEDVFNQAAIMEGGGARVPEPMMFAARRVRPPGAPELPPMPASGGAPPPDAAPPEPAPFSLAPTSAGVTNLQTGTRGMAQVPWLRDMTPAQASVTAASEPHLIPKPGGGYVGAPESVKNYDDLQQLRANFDAKVEAGVAGRDWYHNERSWIDQLTGNDPVQGRQVASGLAIYSQQADPNTNLQFFTRAWNPVQAGVTMPPVKTGPQDLKFTEGMSSGDPNFGLKTGPFSWQLSPDRDFATTAVNDIHHMRAWGFEGPNGTLYSGSPGPEQHKWVDYETQLAIDRANARGTGGFDDWNAARIQAAPWTSQKESSLNQRFPKRPAGQNTAEARSGFSDYAPGVTGYMPHEQVPGASTGLFDVLPANQREDFSGQATWAHPGTGRDMLTGNMFLQGPMRPGYGAYLNSRGEVESNPALTARPLIDTAKGVNPRVPADLTQQALTTASGVRGMLDMQELSPWHFVDKRTDQPVGTATSLRMDGARPTPAQMAAVNQVASKHGFYASDTGDGISLLNSGEGNAPKDGTELKKRLAGGMQQELEQALPGANFQQGYAKGDAKYLADDLDYAVRGQGRTVSSVLADLDKLKQDAPGWHAKLMNDPNVGVKARDNLARIQDPRYGTAGVRPDYEKMLGIIAKGGNLQALADYVRKNGAVGLPAALGAWGLSQGSQGGQDQRQ